MYFVYFLRSINNPNQTYIGFTTNIEQRLETYNSGGSIHTAKYRPWNLITYVAFEDQDKAKSFEKYVKVGSGNAWAKKHLW
jgi:predicted GIY-YIG superfamily endonuclease